VPWISRLTGLSSPGMVPYFMMRLSPCEYHRHSQG
jgi:hypothetical protein